MNKFYVVFYFQFKLFISKDFGITWEAIRKNVVDFSWGTKEMDKDLIYIVTDDVNPSEDKNPQGKEINRLFVFDVFYPNEMLLGNVWN